MKGTKTTHRPDEKPLNAGLLLPTSRSLAHSYRHRTDRVLDDRPWNTHADERWERSAVFHGLRARLGCCAGITVYAGAAVAGLAAVLAASATAFRQGLLSNLPNPKIALIFLTLIPQFISMGEPASTTTVALARSFFPRRDRVVARLFPRRRHARSDAVSRASTYQKWPSDELLPG